MLQGFIKALVITSAFFIACNKTLFAHAAPSCPGLEHGESARVRHVHDGDTVMLEDGRKIRLIGIDTPELARDGQPSQPYAEVARDHARQLIQQYGNVVQLHYEPERMDHYRRILAHILLSDGSSLQARLIDAGLAVAYTTPPNDRYSHCYQHIETRAQQKRAGFWEHTKYQVIASEQITPSINGFRLVNGRVTHIGTSKKAIWLNFGRTFAARIAKKDLAHFDGRVIDDYLGQVLTVRGWIRHRNGKTIMSVRHPSLIHFIPPAE